MTIVYSCERPFKRMYDVCSSFSPGNPLYLPRGSFYTQMQMLEKYEEQKMLLLSRCVHVQTQNIWHLHLLVWQLEAELESVRRQQNECKCESEEAQLAFPSATIIVEPSLMPRPPPSEVNQSSNDPDNTKPVVDPPFFPPIQGCGLHGNDSSSKEAMTSSNGIFSSNTLAVIVVLCVLPVAIILGVLLLYKQRH